MSYLVYLITSKSKNLYYIGMTNDFFNRWLQHNGIKSGGAKYTKKATDWYPICIIDGFKNKQEAMQCEWRFKTRKSRLARSKAFKGRIGRLHYLSHLLKQTRWTSNSPKINDQDLTIYIDDEYQQYLNTTKPTKELYWKY